MGGWKISSLFVPAAPQAWPVRGQQCWLARTGGLIFCSGEEGVGWKVSNCSASLKPGGKRFCWYMVGRVFPKSVVCSVRSLRKQSLLGGWLVGCLFVFVFAYSSFWVGVLSSLLDTIKKPKGPTTMLFLKSQCPWTIFVLVSIFQSLNTCLLCYVQGFLIASRTTLEKGSYSIGAVSGVYIVIFCYIHLIVGILYSSHKLLWKCRFLNYVSFCVAMSSEHAPKHYG